MKFGELLEQAARSDWAANYVNYQRAKDQIKTCDVKAYKNFIHEECAKVERFYRSKLEDIETEGNELSVLMAQSSSQVSGLVKRSWNHTEELRGLYDYGRLNFEGIRKALKKYDKVMKHLKPELQNVFFEQIKKEYNFFKFRDELKPILEKCASFWSQDQTISHLQGKSTSEIQESLRALPAFPLADQMAHQAQSALEPMTEDDEEEEEEEDKKDSEVSPFADEPNGDVEEQNDNNFERDFLKQQRKAKKDAVLSAKSKTQDKPKWQEMLADYQHLNSLLKSLASVAQGRKVATTGVASLSMSDAPDMAYGASPEIVHQNKPFKEVDWFRLVDKEMEKVSQKTNDEIQRVRRKLAECREKCERWSKDTKDKNQEQTGDQMTSIRVRTMLTKLGVLESEAKQLGQDFLALEKFVNLNYQAFEKLLKNHDKLMPSTPCHQFYMTKLRHQGWIRCDFSDVFVTLSDCHSLLRQDDSGQANTDAKQDFVRNTKKYWVPTEHVSSLKHLVLQHLPVFRMWTDSQRDSQLVNSVYFDNRQMQLYHGRMDKNPGAIALRLRWYGTEVRTVYVERKTHLDAWTGNVSVKERFTLEERLTVPFLNGSYTVNEYADDMKRRGKKDTDIQEACKLFSQIARVIESKQLGPTVRTQYMRTAFQIPFDSTVRISLDTNLAMVREDCCGYAATITERWRRDERIPVKASEHTHFPHAILEVKLQGDIDNPPAWVKDMISSGMVTEVYKFSKFIHGSAVLLTELVGAAPYWIDDVSIRDSVNASAPTAANKARRSSIKYGNDAAQGPRRTEDDALTISSFTDPRTPVARDPKESDVDDATHPLLGRAREGTGGPRHSDYLGRNAGGGGDGEDSSCCGLLPGNKKLPRKVPVRVEPKTYFANERTFLSWVNMSVTLGSISSALTVFGDNETAAGAGTQVMSLLLTLVATFFVAYAMYTFHIRRQAIRKREDAGLNQVVVPILIACTLVLSLCGVLISNVTSLDAPSKQGSGGTPAKPPPVVPE
eukprot:Tamp_00833.p1 GENE.Tamp_00833~~Tamp_00833.p1  ORF type:complete len:1007 (+),score=271.07 Tamp_00833:253-3273(+)